jgi:hypothetical protein
MNHKTFSLVAGLIFSGMAILHLVRLVLGWQAMIAGMTVPLWASWVGILVAGYLAYEGLRLSRQP